ncbi:MAG: hypothetical protein GYA47_14335, partial [Desulfovibrio sp.]|nr:hypothetical protein [Desulfovibrio sp.]
MDERERGNAETGFATPVQASPEQQGRSGGPVPAGPEWEGLVLRLERKVAHLVEEGLARLG